ncbi:hypothetical protein [Tunicatimonas pelagia]|uniref:hypothetical protein n=1 Tax=Tunicatimonas pelagia TaxID=931531 RepID=UPI0026650EA1|nr:hypothetical protein [Tunicatimonas pelagia]WKN41976.1 hypothetical protein P0M28_23320 [Tunicatimonas pelagia]
MHSLLFFNSQHSRTFLLLIMGIDATLLAGSFFLYATTAPHYLLVVAILSWWILLLLTHQCQPDDMKFPRIVGSTTMVGAGHISFMIIICVVNQKVSYISPLIYLILLFFVSRVAIFTVLHKLHYYARTITHNTLRFVIIGDKDATISKLLHNYLLQSEAKFVGYVDVVSVEHAKPDDLLELYQKFLARRVSHIYCTLPLPRWTTHVNKLQQLADDHFIYFHWLSDSSSEDSSKQHLDFKMKNLMVYTPHK